MVFRVKASRTPAFSDLLDYGTKAERNVYLLKSGGLMSLYEIELPDTSTLSPDKVEAMYLQAQMALLKCEPNYCIQFDALRLEDSSYLPHLENTHEVLRDLEAEKEKLFKLEGSFKTKLFFTITYIGDTEKMHVLQRTMVKGEKAKSERDKTQEVIQNFKANCEVVVDALNLSFKVTPLGIKEESFTRLSENEIAEALSINAAPSFIYAKEMSRTMAAPPTTGAPALAYVSASLGQAGIANEYDAPSCAMDNGTNFGAEANAIAAPSSAADLATSLASAKPLAKSVNSMLKHLLH